MDKAEAMEVLRGIGFETGHLLALASRWRVGTAIMDVTWLMNFETGKELTDAEYIDFAEFAKRWYDPSKTTQELYDAVPQREAQP